MLMLEVKEDKDEMQKQLIDHTMLVLPIHYVLWIQIVLGTHIVADSGFGSVEAVMALMLERGLYVMAAVKTAHSYFPLKYIQSWSKQFGGERGDSIVLKSTYLDNNGKECPLYATGWNDKKCKTIISNCGTSARVDNAQRARTTTVMDPNTKELKTVKYTKSIKRIDIVKKFHEYFPAVDIHNHYHQGSLAFERYWKTKKIRLRFFMTLLGVCITNSFLMYDLEYMRSQSTGISHNSNSNSSSNEIDEEEKLDFTNFLNKLAHQMIFNDRDISSNSSSTQQAKKRKKKGIEQVEDEQRVHELLPHPSNLRRNCLICSRQVRYFCSSCSNIDSDDGASTIWLCSPEPSKHGEDKGVSRQCYAKHIIRTLTK
jgi:hypothetical protein